MCNDIGEGSRCCAFYSFTGFIFTLWCGAMVTMQPFFISGIEDQETAQSSAYGAMGMFLATFVVSMLGIWYDSKKKSNVEVDYGDYGPDAIYGSMTKDGVPDYGATH